MINSVGFDLHILYWYIYIYVYVERERERERERKRESDLYLAQTNITYTWKIDFQGSTSPSNKLLSSPAIKVCKLSLHVQLPVQSALQLFLLMLLAESFYVYFC